MNSSDVIEIDETVSEAKARREIENHGVLADELNEILAAAYLGPNAYSSATILIELGY